MRSQDESVPPDFDLNCSAVAYVKQSISLPINHKCESTKSTNACSPSEINGRKIVREPTDVTESSNIRTAYSRNTPSNKTFFYQDIHSEYNKRHF